MVIIVLGFAKDNLDIIDKVPEFIRTKSSRQPVDTVLFY